MNIFATISLVISIMMLAFVVIGVLYGLIVGFKKSLASGIYNLVLVIVLIIVTSSLTTIVLQFDITSFNLQANGTVCATLGDYIIALIESNAEIANAITTYPNLKDVILTLPSLIASPFIFVILFWAIKIVVFIISLPINLIVMICKAHKKKPVNAQGKVIKPKKRRLLGMACGLVIGLIAIFATMVPLFGLGSAVMKLNDIKMSGSTASIMLYADSGENTNEKSLLDTLLGEETSKAIVETYKGNVGINITRIIGMEAIGNTAFNTLTKTKINGTEVKLLDDLTTVMMVYQDMLDIQSYFDKESLTQKEMQEFLDKTDNIINKVFEVKFLTAVGNTVLPIVIDQVLNNEDPNSLIQLPEEIKNDEVKKYLITHALNVLQNYDFSLIKTILNSTLSSLKVVNNNGILTPVYNSIKSNTNLKTNDYLNLIKNTEEDFASTLINPIISLDFVKDISPVLVDGAFSGLFKALGKTYVSNEITKEKATDYISNLVSNAINGIKTLDLNSNMYITKNSFSYVGKILDSFKDPEILSNQQYSDLLDVVKSELKNSLGSLTINLNNVIDNLSDVDVWETELNQISKSFDEIKYFYNEIKSGINLEKIDFTKLGKMFDNFELTKLFGGEIRPIYNDILENNKSNLSDFAGALDILKISDTDLTNASLTKVEWEKELTSLQPLIKELLNFKNINLTTDNKANAEKLIEICKKFDAVEQDENSKIFSKKMQPLLIEALTIAKNQDVANTLFYENIIARINNRASNETLTYCVEKGCITYAVNKAISEATTEHGIKTALENSRNFIIENNTIQKLFDSMDVINAEIESLETLNPSDIQSVDIIALSSSLNKIKNTGSFPVMFTNKILSNILSEVDYSSIPEGSEKTAITNYISEKKALLENESTVIDDNSYLNILQGLKDLIPTV